MVKKIGSIFALCAIIIVYPKEPTITLSAHDPNGAPLMSAVVGVPFMLHVTVEADELKGQVPTIAGLKSFHVDNYGLQSTIHSSINGVSSTKKIFGSLVRIDKEGTYKLGPATIALANQKLVSNSFEIQVAKQARINNAEAQLKISVDKEKAFIGEKIIFTLRFIAPNNASLLEVSQPKFPGFAADELKGPFSGYETIDGNKIPYLEWRADLYPEKIGTVTLPALQANYKIDRKEGSRFSYDFFDAFFARGFEHKTVYSNALTFEIEALPPHDPPVKALGDFKTFTARVNSNRAKQGEGIVLTLMLEGSGNMKSIEPPILNMPSELSFYDSKHFIDEQTITQPVQKKYFEYIIQGNKIGEWQIPPQTFTYFDNGQKKYKTLSTNAIPLTIIDSGAKADIKKEVAPETEQKKENSVIKQFDYADVTLNNDRKIAWPLFFGVIIVLTMLLAALAFIKRARQYRAHHADYYAQKNAFFNARKSLKMQYKNPNFREMYDIFITLFEERCQIPRAEVSQERINYELQKVTSNKEVIDQWNDFFEKLSQAAYFNTATISRDELFKQSQFWISTLEKII